MGKPLLRKVVPVLLLVSILALYGFAQTVPFQKGVNLTGWFQASGVGQVQFTKYTKKDFEQLRSLGVDVVRLPVNLHGMTGGEPDYLIKPLFFTFMDEVINYAEEVGIYLIIDNTLLVSRGIPILL